MDSAQVPAFEQRALIRCTTRSRACGRARRTAQALLQALAAAAREVASRALIALLDTAGAVAGRRARRTRRALLHASSTDAAECAVATFARLVAGAVGAAQVTAGLACAALTVARTGVASDECDCRRDQYRYERRKQDSTCHVTSIGAARPRPDIKPTSRAGCRSRDLLDARSSSRPHRLGEPIWRSWCSFSTWSCRYATARSR